MKTYQRPSRGPRPCVISDAAVLSKGQSTVKLAVDGCRMRFPRIIVQVGGNANQRRAFVHQCQAMGLNAWRVESTGKQVATYEVSGDVWAMDSAFSDSGVMRGWIEGEPELCVGIRPPMRASGSGADKKVSRAPGFGKYVVTENGIRQRGTNAVLINR